MRSWFLVRLNTRLERSVEPLLASMCSLDQEKFNAEITDFNFKRNNTLTCSAICRSLLVSCPPGAMVSSYRRSSLSLLAATYSAVSSDRRLAILSWFRARLVSSWTGVSLERWAARFLAATAPPFHRSGGQPYAYALVSRPTGVRQRTVSSFLPLVTRKVKLFLKKAIISAICRASS